MRVRAAGTKSQQEPPPWAAKSETASTLATRTLSRREAEEREAWRARRHWPCVVLGIDPGATAGASILVAGELVASFAVETASRDLEMVVGKAIETARSSGFILVPIIEEWGRGGPRGIDQWIGLGAALGAWRRTIELARRDGASDVMTKGRVARASMPRWRSRMIEETGERDISGKFVAFDASGWKRAATRAVLATFPGHRVGSSDEAEAILIGAYGSKCDEVGELIPATVLRRHGFVAA